MNVLLVGFSTTGKSSLLKELKEVLPDHVQYIDSDKWISKEHNEHIYRLFLNNHDPKDPINRILIMDSIQNGENDFIMHLKQNTGAYVAAIGPNVHTRTAWEEYLRTAKPYVIYLKADVDTVYNGLKKREDDLNEDIKNSEAFGIWNLGVTRKYDAITETYVELSENEAKRNIAALINVNEAQYEKMANVSFEAVSLFSWHPANKEVDKLKLLEIVQTCIKQNTEE